MALVADAGAALALVAVIGQWPGGVNSEVARWQLQAACGDAVGRVPLTRWSIEVIIAPKCRLPAVLHFHYCFPADCRAVP